MADSRFAADELSAEEEQILRNVEDAPPPKEEEQPSADSQPAGDVAVQPEQPNPEGPAAEPEPEQPRDEKGKFAEKRQVPLAELIEERKARQAAEKEFAEFKGRTEAALAAITQRVQQKPVEQPKPIDVDQDPVGALKDTRTQLAQLTQQREQEAQFNQFRGHVAQQEAEFRAQTPDYDNALQYARQARIQELKVMGLNDAQAAQQLALDEFNFSAVSIKNGRNVGQALYEFATARGYKKAAPAQEKPVQTQTQPSALEKLATIQAGQQASKSLGGAAGAAGAAPLTVEALLAMTPEQIDKVPEDVFRRLMGG